MFLLLVLILLHLLLIWSFKYVPSQDGAAHLYGAHLLLDFARDAQTPYGEYYTLNLVPVPNWMSSLVLMGLMSWLPALVAQKTLVSIYIVLWPLALIYALRAVRRDAGWLAVVSMPLVLNWPLHMGFYNFVFSLPMFYLVVGYWMRRRGGGRARTALVLGLLSLALYFCHLVSTVQAWIAIGVLTLWDGWWERRGGGGRFQPPSARSGSLRRCAWTAAAALPTLALVVWYLSHPQSIHDVAAGPLLQPSLSKFNMLLNLYHVLVSFNILEMFTAAAAAILFLLMAIGVAVARLRVGRLQRGDGVLLVIVVFLAIFLFAPRSVAGGTFLVERLVLYPFLLLPLWLATQPFTLPLRRIVQWFAAALTLVALSMHVGSYNAINDLYEEYLRLFDQVRQGSVVLPIVSISPRDQMTEAGDPLAWRVDPLLHASGYAAVRRRLIDLSDYAGSTTYFPTRWRPERDPRRHIGEVGAPSPLLEFLTYPQLTGGRVDYVVLWFDGTPKDRSRRRIQSIEDQLRAGFELVAVSRPRGHGYLYRRSGGQGGNGSGLPSRRDSGER